jgi:hypothetical protein
MARFGARYVGSTHIASVTSFSVCVVLPTPTPTMLDYLHYKGNRGTGEHGTPGDLIHTLRANVVSGSNCTHLGRISVLVWASHFG